MKYYQMVLCNPDRWHLRLSRPRNDVATADMWQFLQCRPIPSPTPVPVEIVNPGPALDYNQTGLGTLIISKRLGDIIEQLCKQDVQRIQAQIEAEGEWEILNVLRLVDCIDHERSVIQYFPADHPDHPGEPRGVVELVIDVHRVDGAHVFKPKGWTVVNIVSSRVVEALKDAKITGIEFWAVSR